MSRATVWVGEGQGDTAGYLWDLVINSRALRDCSTQVRVDFISHGPLTEEQRRFRTAIRYNKIVASVEGEGLGWRGEFGSLTPLDIERITTAIWGAASRVYIDERLDDRDVRGVLKFVLGQKVDGGEV